MLVGDDEPAAGRGFVDELRAALAVARPSPAVADDPEAIRQDRPQAGPAAGEEGGHGLPGWLLAPAALVCIFALAGEVNLPGRAEGWLLVVLLAIVVRFWWSVGRDERRREPGPRTVSPDAPSAAAGVPPPEGPPAAP